MKVVINRCYGGFGVSDEVIKTYNERTGYNVRYSGEFERDDVDLIKIIEEFQAQGLDPNDKYSEIKIVEVPDDVNWIIEDYDGMERVEEVHQVWW